MKAKKNQIFISIGFILITGFLLRFWHYFTIPFTFDELSALYRLRFNSLLEVIRQGVMTDTHPAGVQVFLWFWTKWFGMSEYIVKLPFLFLGMASIILTYQIGRIWFGKATGVLAAAYVSSLQLFVMYSQIARPYSSGLFFCLLMVYFWSRYFFESKRTSFLIGFVLSASMATYNHYFSLLFVGIVGLSGLFFVRKKMLVPYLLSGIAILILYIPHIPIFIHQLELGEVEGVGGWLDKPGPYFVIRFFGWLFHFSPWSGGLALLIIMFLLIFGKNKGKRFSGDLKKRIVLGVWLLLPLMVGYLVSILVTPLLQFSTLIFSTPFLFVLMFSVKKEISDKVLVPIVVIILLTNSLTLIFTRQYYRVFYKQPFEEVVKQAIDLEDKYPGEVFMIDDYVPFYSEYYFRKYKKEIPYYTVRNKDISLYGFKEMLSGIKQKMVITSGLDSRYFQLIKEQFPDWVGFEKGFTFEQYIFSKKVLPGAKIIHRKLISKLNFKPGDTKWTVDQKRLIADALNARQMFEFKPETAYGLNYVTSLDSLVPNIYQIIDLEVDLMPLDTVLNAVVVGEVKEKQETVVWRGSDLGELRLKPGIWQKAYLTIDLQQALNNKNVISPDQVFTAYLWNKSQNHFLVRDIKIYLRPGNPLRYALFYDIDD